MVKIKDFDHWCQDISLEKIGGGRVGTCPRPWWPDSHESYTYMNLQYIGLLILSLKILLFDSWSAIYKVVNENYNLHCLLRMMDH